MNKLEEIKKGITDLMSAMTQDNGYNYDYTVKGDNYSQDGQEGDIARFNYDQFPLIEIIASEEINLNDGYDLQIAGVNGFMPYETEWTIRSYFQNLDTDWFSIYSNYFEDLNKLVGENCDISHNVDSWLVNGIKPEANQLGSSFKVYISTVRIIFQEEI